MKQNRKYIGFILSILLLSFSLVFFLQIAMTNLFPTKYLALIVGGYLPIIILFSALLMGQKVKPFLQVWVQILSIILIIIVSILSFSLFRIIHVTKQITKSQDSKVPYYFIALTEETNPEKGITGMIQLESSLKDAFEKKYITTFQTYSDITLLKNAIIEKKVSFLFLSGLEKTIIDINHQELLKDKKILDTFYLIQKEEVIAPKDSIQILINSTEEAKTILSPSKENILLTIHPKQKQIYYTYLPSNYYLSLDGKQGYKEILSLIPFYGKKAYLEAVQNILNISIPYYMTINFKTLFQSVDDMNGLSISLEKDIVMDSKTYQQGKHVLTGNEVYQFFTNATNQWDQKVILQHQIWDAYFKKLFTKKNIILHGIRGLKQIETSVITNFPEHILYQGIQKFLQNPNWNVTYLSLDGYLSRNYTYSNPKEKTYITEPDFDTIQKTISLFKQNYM